MAKEREKRSEKSDCAVLAGIRIKECREKKNLTQEGLSKATGGRLSATRIANYEQGIRELNIEAAILLGAALAEPPAYLMGLLSEEDRRLVAAPPLLKIKLLSTVTHHQSAINEGSSKGRNVAAKRATRAGRKAHGLDADKT